MFLSTAKEWGPEAWHRSKCHRRSSLTCEAHVGIPRNARTRTSRQVCSSGSRRGAAGAQAAAASATRAGRPRPPPPASAAGPRPRKGVAHLRGCVLQPLSRCTWGKKAGARIGRSRDVEGPSDDRSHIGGGQRQGRDARLGALVDVGLVLRLEAQGLLVRDLRKVGGTGLNVGRRRVPHDSRERQPIRFDKRNDRLG